MGNEITETKAVIVTPEQTITEPTARAEYNPYSLIEMAIQSNADIDKLERLMALQERWEANQAKKAYIENMAKFQSECPIIIKSKEGGTTKAGDVAYKYAPIDVVLEMENKAGESVKSLIARHGFSYDLDTPSITTEEVTAVLTISHKDGYSRVFSINMPFTDKTNMMNRAQVVGATSSYAKRYVFLNGFGIMTGDEDTDSITDVQQEDFSARLNEIPEQYRAKWVSMESTVKNRAGYTNLLHAIPTLEQIKNYKENIDAKLEESMKDKSWKLFIQQNSTSANKFIDDITKQIKEKK